MPSKEIRTLLVPYDFSDCAMDALRVAADIARRTGASIALVHVYEPLHGAGAENMRQRAEIEAQFDRVAELAFVQDIPLRKFLLREISLKDMFRNPHLASVDLIVMGSHGATGLKGIIGSNTQRVVRLAPMPVLVVKAPIAQFAPRDVVFASTFAPEDVERFNALRVLLDVFDVRLHLVKVCTPQIFARSDDVHRAMDAFVQRFGLERFTATIYNELSVEEGILRFAQGVDADLIAMITHGRTGFFQMVNGSLTEDIVNRTAFPVLSVRL